MTTDRDVLVVVKRYNRRKQKAIMQAIDAMDGFRVDYSYTDDEDYDAEDYDWDDPCPGISTVMQQMPEDEIDSSMENLIGTIRAVNGGYCKVWVRVYDVLPEPKCYRRKRRKHRRQRSRLAS
jgi:hypothetical protein